MSDAVELLVRYVLSTADSREFGPLMTPPQAHPGCPGPRGLDGARPVSDNVKRPFARR
jgi:hypothetical protein